MTPKTPHSDILAHIRRAYGCQIRARYDELLAQAANPLPKEEKIYFVTILHTFTKEICSTFPTLQQLDTSNHEEWKKLLSRYLYRREEGTRRKVLSSRAPVDFKLRSIVKLVILTLIKHQLIPPAALVEENFSPTAYEVLIATLGHAEAKHVYRYIMGA